MGVVMAKKKTFTKHNPIAASLRDPKFRKQVVPDRSKQIRESEKLSSLEEDCGDFCFCIRCIEEDSY